MEPFAARRGALAGIWSGGAALALVPGMTLYYLTGVRKSLTERPLIWLWEPGGRTAWVAPALERPGLEEAAGPDTAFFTYDDTQDPQGAAAALVAAWGLAGAEVAVEATSMRVLEAGLLAGAGLRPVAGGGAAATRLRAVKDAGEVAALRRAVAIAESSLEAGVARMRPGVTEAEVARAITLEAMRLGSEPFWKEVVVASGPRAASPHTRTGTRALAPGDSVIVDAGAVLDGYVSDITRTFFVGAAAPAWRQRYAAVLAANRAGIAAARPGIALGAIDGAAREVLRSQGLGDFFIHRVGHGIGLEGHEPPYLVPGSRELLQQGTVFTVEPGVYLPGEGGVRIEDDVVCAADGADCLTGYSRELRVVG